MKRGIGFVVLAALIAAGCSSGGAASPASSAQQLSLNGSPLPQYAAPSTGLLASIKERGVIFNGVNAANPPFESVDATRESGTTST